MSKIIKKSIEFAKEAHKDQKYNGRPYLRGHLAKVAAVAKKFTNDEELIAGCFLHDTIEDTDVTLDEVKNKFGNRIAEMVFAVTDGEGQTRQERKIDSYKKLSLSSDGRFIKLCDRIANMQASVQAPKYAKMYLNESQDFVQKLKVDGEHEELWSLYFQLESELKSLVVDD